MILSAQRVWFGPTQDVHLAHYAQDPSLEVGVPLERLAHPGTLVWQRRLISLPHGRIGSYVDVAAPENVTQDEFMGAIEALDRLAEFPAAFVPADSRVGFSLGLDGSLRPTWRIEILQLLEQLLQAHP